jgi:hypothetical protein
LIIFLSAYHFYFYFLSFSPFFSSSQIRQQLEIEHISSIEHIDGGLGGISVQGKCGEEKERYSFQSHFIMNFSFGWGKVRVKGGTTWGWG